MCLPQIQILESVSGWEYVCVEVSQSIPYPQKYVIANIYRPPCEIIETFTTFLTEYDLFLNHLTSEYHSFHYIILRDHIHSIVSSEI